MWDLQPTPVHSPTHPHYRKAAVPTLPSPAQPCPLTSSAGVAQGAADFILVQVGVRDHQDVGAPAQGTVVRSLAPHLLCGQRLARQGRAG